jgi:hypothetical protein
VTAALTASASRTSAVTASASAPVAAVISSAARWATSAWRSKMITRAPSPAKARAIAKPMPCAPPVTMTTRSRWSVWVMCLSHVSREFDTSEIVEVCFDETHLP